MLRAVPRGEIAGGRLELGRAEVGGRRVDQVAAEPDRLDGVRAPDRGRRRAGRRRLTARGVPLRLVARVAIGAEAPGDGGERRIAQRRWPAGSCRSAAIARAGRSSSSDGPDGSPAAPSPKPKRTPAMRPSASGHQCLLLGRALEADAFDPCALLRPTAATPRERRPCPPSRSGSAARRPRRRRRCRRRASLSHFIGSSVICGCSLLASRDLIGHELTSCLADSRGAQDRITEGKARAWPRIATGWSSAIKTGRAGACGLGSPCGASGCRSRRLTSDCA